MRTLKLRWFVLFLLPAVAAAILVPTASPALAQATSLQWNVAAGGWSNSGNWVDNSANFSFYSTYCPLYVNGGLVINNGGTANISAGDYATDTTGNGYVFIGGSDFIGGSGGSGAVNMTGGVVNIPQEILGVASGSGIFTQSGGINCPFTNAPSYPASYYPNFTSLQLGYAQGGYGEYDMSGGALDVNCVYVGASAMNPTVLGGTGVFNQTGGSVGRPATDLAPVQPIGLMVGGNWTGNYSITSSAALTTYVGTYNMSGANTLFVGGGEVVGCNGTGTFTQNGGSNEIVGGGTTALNATPPNSAFNNAYGFLIVGQYGTAYAYHRYAGNGVGTYNLQAGLLDGGGTAAIGQDVGGYEIIGFGGTGTFNQSGGTNNATTALYVGGDAANLFAVSNWARGGSGTYNLTGGIVDVPVVPAGQSGISGAEYLGNGGTGQFNQSGGTNMTPSIYFGGSTVIYNPGIQSGHQGWATYNLSGGLLQTGDISLYFVAAQASNCTFNFTGGTLQASNPFGDGSFYCGVPITVGTAASNIATVDANGQTVRLNGAYALSGPGQLRVIDSAGGGTVVLGGLDSNGTPIANFFTGGTKVFSGTLELLNPQALPATGDVSVGSPGAKATLELGGNNFFFSVPGLSTSNSAGLNFQTPGLGFLVIGSDGLNIGANTAISFGTNPTVPSDYPVLFGDPTMIAGVDLTNFVLPTAPAGLSYSLSIVTGDPSNGFALEEGECIDLVVTAVPEPGMLALLAAGLLAFAWWRRK